MEGIMGDHRGRQNVAGGRPRDHLAGNIHSEGSYIAADRRARAVDNDRSHSYAVSPCFDTHAATAYGHQPQPRLSSLATGTRPAWRIGLREVHFISAETAARHAGETPVLPRRCGGSVLIVVLWACLGLVSVTLLFGHSMLLAYRGADNDLSGRQAE